MLKFKQELAIFEQEFSFSFRKRLVFNIQILKIVIKKSYFTIFLY